MKRTKERIALALVCLSTAGLTFGLCRLGQSQQEYQKGEDTYQEVEQEFVKHPESPEGPDKPEGTDNPAPGQLQIDFDGLKAMNKDVIAWVDIPGAGISYPVLQAADNSYYLKHLSTGESGIHGSIFLDCHNKPDFSDPNSIIYGHNMKDGTMFAGLDAYQDFAFYQQHPYFYIHLSGYRLEYQIFSCYSGRVGSSGYTYSFGQEEAVRDFLNDIESCAAYQTGVEVKTTDHIVTLSTCVNTDRNYRYLIHGKEVRKTKEEKHD